MKPRSTILLFALLGTVLEGAAFFIGIAFTGVNEFGPYWPLAAIYDLGLGPDWLLPGIPASSPWSAVYLALPIFFLGAGGNLARSVGREAAASKAQGN